MPHLLQRTTASLCLASASLLMGATTASASRWHDPDLANPPAIRIVTVTEQRLTPDELAIGALVGIALSGTGFVMVKVARRRQFQLFAFHL